MLRRSEITDGIYVCVSDGPRLLAVKCNGRANTSGENIVVGEVMTVTADSNPATRNYTWKNTTSNEIIETGESITVTVEMFGRQSLKVVVCNTIPIPSPHTVCSDLPVNVVVISKCVSIVFILDGVLGESGCFEHYKTYNVERFKCY